MSEATTATPGSKATRLLIVDDEAVIRFVLRCELRQSGLSVDEVADGRAALETFRRDPAVWAGAFVDLLLPDVDGTQLIAQFKRLRPDLPVVLMTGDLDPEIEDRARAGEIPILRKPFPLECIRPFVAQMIQQSEAARVDGDRDQDQECSP